jgi:hypothetical protein
MKNNINKNLINNKIKTEPETRNTNVINQAPPKSSNDAFKHLISFKLNKKQSNT